MQPSVVHSGNRQALHDDQRLAFAAARGPTKREGTFKPSQIELAKSEAAVKVEAQDEVLGNDARKRVRPQGTIETFGFWSRTPRSDCQHWSIIPFLLRPAVASLWVASLWHGLLFAGAP